MAGYAGTPLAKKLGIKEQSKVVAIGAPKNYRELLEPVPDAVKFSSKLAQSADIVHIFSTRKSDLSKLLIDCRKQLNPEAMIWVSWPKKAAKVPTDITEDIIREMALPMGLVDVKVCAVDEVWSGLKLVVRKGLR